MNFSSQTGTTNKESKGWALKNGLPMVSKEGKFLNFTTLYGYDFTKQTYFSHRGAGTGGAGGAIAPPKFLDSSA